MIKKNVSLFIIFLLILAVACFSLFYFHRKNSKPKNLTEDKAEASISNRDISINYPKDFGLAVSKNQMLIKSYIPPCSENFDYCFYYNGDNYRDTNFESAGLRIKKRDDLSLKESCLNSSPEGFVGLEPRILDDGRYATSLFSPLGDAAAGHYSSGELFRLY